jgi:hypothetical protein
MNFLEKNLEDIIYETDNESLNERGLYIEGRKYRQIRIGNYGVCDLITFKKHIYPWGKDYIISVYELKKDEINEKTFFQALRYVRGVQRYLKNRGTNIRFKFEICLIGNSVNNYDNIQYVASFCDKIDIYTYKYKYDGIYFELNPEVFLREEGFNG